jgi:hypothetical protein
MKSDIEKAAEKCAVTGCGREVVVRVAANYGGRVWVCAYHEAKQKLLIAEDALAVARSRRDAAADMVAQEGYRAIAGDKSGYARGYKQGVAVGMATKVRVETERVFGKRDKRPKKKEVKNAKQ